MIEVRAYFSGWHEATKERALAHYKNFWNSSPAISEGERREYYNNKMIRGAYIDENEKLVEVKDND